MARTIAQIYDQIISEKENRTALNALLPASDNSTQLLDDLQSDSKVAVWRLWAYIIATVTYTHEVLWDIFKKDVEEIVRSAPAGTPDWLKKKVQEYQHGDSLDYIDQTYKYAEIDRDKQIVKSCAINERTNGTVFIKVAKDDGSGGLTALSASEKNGVESYVNKIKFAGMKTAVFTATADQLTIVYDLYYDPIVPLETLIETLEIAIKDHLSNLKFDGALNVNKFTDALQAVEGVVDPVFVSGQSEVASGDITEFTIEHEPGAGYFVLADELVNMFNFIAKV